MAGLDIRHKMHGHTLHRHPKIRGWGDGGGVASFVNCGFLKLLPGYLVLADRGFDIKDSVGMMCAEVQIPAFTKSRCQLDAKDVFLWLSGRALC